MKLRNRRCDGLGRERQRRAPPRRASHYAPLFLFALGVLVVGPVAPARAQGDMGPLIDRMERMEREMITLQRNLYRGDQQPPPADAGGAAVVIPQPAVGGMQVRMWELEQEIRGLTGQVEQIGFQVRQMNDRLDKLVADMDFRMQALEQQAGGQPAQAAIAPITPPAAGISPLPRTAELAAPDGQPPSVRTLGQVRQQDVEAVRAGAPAPGAAVAPLPGAPQVAAVTPRANLPEGTPESQYDYAYGLLMQRDFAGAEGALRSFVSANPDHRLSGNAQYWLGETFYVREDYLTAARTFAEGYTTYPQSDKAPSNLLKLGMSLDALGRTEDACITFTRLREEYPDAAANILSRGEREHQRLGCP